MNRIENNQVITPEILRSEIDFIWFDMDGTLYQRDVVIDDEILIKAIEQVAINGEYGWEEAKQLVSSTYVELRSMKKTLGQYGIDGRKFMADVWKDLPLEAVIPRDADLCRMLAALEVQGFGLGIVSNSNYEKDVLRKLKVIGLSPKQFKQIVATGDLPVDKPDPAVFTYALMGVDVKPERSLFVGDSRRADIEGARRVGMWTAKIGDSYERADLNFAEIYDLGRFLGIKV